MVNNWLNTLATELEVTTPDRHEELLEKLATWIVDHNQRDSRTKVSFICTHNSRRSQFAQVWFNVVQKWAGIDVADSYSGGTEVTACNERTIAALRRAGLQINSQNSDATNPIYELNGTGSKEQPLLKLWSKVYDDKQNPSENFAAVMTCDHADQNCPFIPGASIRIPLTYTDPKYADDSDQEEQAYDYTCKVIATDMIRLINKLKKQLN